MRPEHVGDPGQGGFKQGRVVIVGPGGDHVQRDPFPVTGDRPFRALFAPINRAAPGHLATARRLGDRPVHRQVVQLQPDHLVVGGQSQAQQFLADAGLGPLGEATADRAVRAAR
jgi:hypothetical protein